MEKIVTPRVLKGFRDIQPQDQKRRETCIATLQRVFSNFGFLPIDTPILEYEEILLSQQTQKDTSSSETEKQVYKFSDRGKRDVAMRFDLTVPFARFIAEHHHKLTLPFNRYQIGKVFRGENTQRGRYREFIQCDFDIIGIDSALADSTIIQIIDTALSSLNIADVKDAQEKKCNIHISHRALLNEFLQKEKCQEHALEILRILDKMRKLPIENIVEQLCAITNEQSAKNIISFCKREKTNKDTFIKLENFLTPNSPALKRLQEIEQSCTPNTSCANIIIDPSIMRGLDYYTGFVCETFLTNFSDIGSICSGGRYDNLTQRFSKTALSGVGASIGLDRLLSVLPISELTKSPTHTIIYCHNAQFASQAFLHQKKLQQQNISVEVFPNSDGLKQVFKYAQRVQAAFLIILGEEELQTNSITIKNLFTREQKQQISLEKTITWIHSLNQ